MSKIDINVIAEKLRVDGRTSHRMPFTVGKVRRLLWPFIRSYHLIGLDWTRHHLEDLDKQLAFERDKRVELQSRLDGELDKLVDVQSGLDAERNRGRALRAELLAQAHENAGRRAALTNLSEIVEVQRAAIANLSDALFASRLSGEELCAASAGLHAAQIMPSEADGTGIIFQLGSAGCYRTCFGPMVLRIGDLITETVAKRGSWDDHLIPWIERAAKLGPNAIDAGAHFGLLSCAMAQYFETVHSFEPSLLNYAYLRANSKLCQRGRIVPKNLGLFSSNTRISFGNAGQQEIPLDTSLGLNNGFIGAGNTGALTFTEDGSGINSIEAISLDSLKLENVGLIKIDCQGNDGAVIVGARETIARCRPIVVFEWEEFLSRNSNISFNEVRKLFNDLGYKLEIIHKHNEKQIDYAAVPSDM